MILLWLCALLQTTAPADLAPGLKVTFESLEKGAPVARDARIARLAAINVPRGTFFSPFLPAGAFSANFEGYINLKLRGDYFFTVEGRGEVELSLNGKVVLQAAGDDWRAARSDRVRLKKGPNLLKMRYNAPATGDASLRLFWAERDRSPEPVSPTLLTHDASDASFKKSLEVRRGRELVAELRCTKCHSAPSEAGAMPELASDAPSLNDIGARLNTDWMTKWINDPKSIRADVSMPRLFRGSKDQVDSRAADIAAFLGSLGRPPQQIQFQADDVASGAHLATALGCIACHNEKAARSLQLTFVRDKWRPAALAEFLRNPQKHYAWTRMPDFKLSEDESRQLAAFLIEKSSPAAGRNDVPSGDPARGETLLATSGCLNCHALDGHSASLAAKAFSELAALDRGCVTDQPNAPEFNLGDADRSAIAAFANSDRSSLARDTAIDFAERHVRRLNCVACHARDSEIEAWSSLKPQIEAIESKYPLAHDVLPMSGDQARPSLTWAGEKLRGDWTANFIGGRIDYKPRPWLAARMPAFPAYAKGIAEGLAHEHGIPFLDEPTHKPIDAELVEIGRKLVGKASGFSCTACHAIGSAPATSTFEAQGANFVYTHDRMREDFYRRWVRNPQRYEPGTRMPQYSDAQGETPLKDIESGDAEKQFHAIWQYLRQGGKMPPAD